MLSWALHFIWVDSKQPDNTPNFCKASVNHFRWRTIFKLCFPHFVCCLEFCFECFLGGWEKESAKIEFKRVGLFSLAKFHWVRSVNSTCLSCEFALTEQLWIYSIPNVNTLSQKMPIGRVSHHLSSGPVCSSGYSWRPSGYLIKPVHLLGLFSDAYMQFSFFIDFSISVLTNILCASQKTSLASYLISLLWVLKIYIRALVCMSKNILNA